MDLENCRGIMVYCEIDVCGIIDNSLELIGHANTLKEKMEHYPEVTAVIIGSDVGSLITVAARHGADRVIMMDNPRYRVYRPDLYSDALAAAAEKYRPEILLVGASLSGEEIGPTVAMKLHTGMAAHCVELKIRDDGQFVQVVPAFGGKVLGDILCPGFRPQMASMKAGMVSKRIFEGKVAEIESFDPDVRGFGDRLQVIETIPETRKRVSLSNAELVVTGGFGIGTQEGWDKLEHMAELLHGVSTCTRPALDAGWTDKEETMVGTSGVAIKPKVYLGFGVSGAAHHTCGIKGAGLIISVNRDANAPIFEVSDFKVVSDWEAIVNAITARLEATSAVCPDPDRA
ncbi:MAG: electron transfer flavoprotein subunit alpha/FixB family protein [Spirochaetales bacterium]|nr:MAG: electron transfer flavoprotein subunit alpha/FixB family protein [Spirochaetales bacterium]